MAYMEKSREVIPAISAISEKLIAIFVLNGKI